MTKPLIGPRKKPTGGQKERTPEDRERHFWGKVAKGDPNACWEWSAGRHKTGYGAFAYVKPNKNAYAHRMAFMYANKLTEYPAADVVIMHTCDNPPCCNPAHLRAGTHVENLKDMMAKGRMSLVRAKGVRQAKAKLNDDKVRAIRTSPLGKVKLARQYGVSPAVIVSVRMRRTWRHVE